MLKEKPIEKHITGILVKRFKDHFGKGPTSVDINLDPPYFTMHLRDLLTPTEEVLLNNEKITLLLELRNCLLESIIPKLNNDLWRYAGIELEEVCYDWNLGNQSGMIWGKIKGEEIHSVFTWPPHLSYKVFENKLHEVIRFTQKTPAYITTCWSGNQIIIARLQGVLSETGKEFLIKGHENKLKDATQKMAGNSIHYKTLEFHLNRSIEETFVKWDIQNDQGDLVFLLNQAK
ncbi:Na-translocating system protein MpsC family protein [Salibacterium aidingense]|uniref:Na-translocating system protein MpsC family protein n=1 Tax=Salibacterium aidingense TaxID=384933 RepID=UPI003BBA35F8